MVVNKATSDYNLKRDQDYYLAPIFSVKFGSECLAGECTQPSAGYSIPHQQKNFPVPIPICPKMQSFFRTGLDGFSRHNLMPLNPSAVVLFMSSHFDHAGYAKIHQNVWNNLQPKDLIGGIVDSVNGQAGWALLCLNGTNYSHYFNRGISKQKQVGRWPSNVSVPEFSTNTDFKSVSQPSRHAKYLVPNHWDQIKNANFLTIGDQDPHDLMRFLNTKYPSSNKVLQKLTRPESSEPEPLLSMAKTLQSFTMTRLIIMEVLRWLFLTIL